MGQLFKLLISTDIAMQRCILGNIFDNHFILLLLLKRKWIQKNLFFEDGGVLFLRFYGAIVCDVLELPPIIFLWKNYLVPLQEGQLLSLFLHSLAWQWRKFTPLPASDT